jgi:hypothetical protein
MDAISCDHDRRRGTPLLGFARSRTASPQEAIRVRLVHEPAKESRAIKRLRPNSISEFELRVGDLQAMYVIDEAHQAVIIGVVGEKRGNQLFVEGREYHDHESD